MKVIPIQCGEFANESERQAFEAVKQKLGVQSGSDEWIVLSNLPHSSTAQHQSDEIDLLVIGPQGLFVIEVKHWDRAWMKKNQTLVDSEAEKLSAKVRRVATNSRRRFEALPKVNGYILLTAESKPFSSLGRPEHRGIKIFTLKEIVELFDLTTPAQLSPAVVKGLCHYLEPRSVISVTGSLRRLGDFINLELESHTSERFHRVYRGAHARTQDRIILHLYDLSAFEGSGTENLAAREFETMQRLQKSPWVPRFRDSLQDVQGFVGEMKFFTVVDPCAPTIRERSADKSWSTNSRIAFAHLAIKALAELHSSSEEDAPPIVHRNLCPSNILVTARNRVLYTGFSLARIPGEETVSKVPLPIGEPALFSAVEVRERGIGSADQRSDCYSLAASLLTIFEGVAEGQAAQCRTILQSALLQKPDDRPTLSALIELLAPLVAEKSPTGSAAVAPAETEQPLPLPRYWSEDLLVQFKDKYFRIISRLGRGGIGLTFKVVEVDPATGENFGTYVAKVINEEASGKAALKAYQRVRAHTSYPNLSVIYEAASTWQNNSFVALLKWVEGDALSSLYGVIPLVAEESGDASIEVLVLRWSKDLCEALSRLHRVGLVHGDVSPANIIVHHGEVCLTDYDLVTLVGNLPSGHGAVMFCSPQAEQHKPLTFSDDVYALGASLFRAAIDREPFPVQGATFDKSKGVQWQDEEKVRMPLFAEFLSRATTPIPEHRFASAMVALEWLDSKLSPQLARKSSEPSNLKLPTTLTTNQVPWLKHILQVFPGSAYGNIETRGLDSAFAADTYVETALEKVLFEEILARHVRLVILCGNAGDGKTAFLQHLAKRFSVPECTSAQRLWESTTSDGLRLRANLDGAASFGGKSASELLDEFFAPFMQGYPEADIAHLLAINDGRLLEWIDRYQGQNDAAPLIKHLNYLLDQESDITLPDSHIRLIDLNSRSLVGGIRPDTTTVNTEFLDKLVDKLLGGDRAAEIWKPCSTCSALERCQAGRNARLLRENQANSVGRRIRERLAESLQAVHQRAEVHITARELRATLSYILFGIHYCTDLHERPELRPPGYWDLAFEPTSELRQGEVLQEFTFLDPALDAHPMIDRLLAGHSSRELSHAGPAYPELSLASARRRAYFEWQPQEIQAVGTSTDALGLAHGIHLSLFKEAGLRDAPLNADLCRRLCRGVSRLEDLPLLALKRIETGRVPLKVSPRTPTDSIFWVEKLLERFTLESEVVNPNSDLPRLHRRLFLIYSYHDGRKEVLSMGYELFHTLLELESGFQLSDTTSDDLFANLAVFTQRLAQEGESSLFAWNPQDERNFYRVGIDKSSGHQMLVCRALGMQET
ncbi:MAG: NERD domain-containing protein [Nitrospira sp.]